METIAFTKVKLPFGWMSNMSPHPITCTGTTWRTSEALFQAYRFSPDDPIRTQIHLQTSPMAAKMVAKKEVDKMVIKPQSSEDLALMEFVLRLKLEAHPNLADELKATGDALIIEDCSKRPHGSGLFWGAEKVTNEDETIWWRGSNNLGHLWMKLRTELLNG